jgi:hypothetical protein
VKGGKKGGQPGRGILASDNHSAYTYICECVYLYLYLYLYIYR